ncbi:Uncharacterised protein [Streptococcus pneumoniae]|nr:Uncharacterised protein [Streptococcus pneumoniae]
MMTIYKRDNVWTSDMKLYTAILRSIINNYNFIISLKLLNRFDTLYSVIAGTIMQNHKTKIHSKSYLSSNVSIIFLAIEDHINCSVMRL